VTGATPGGDAIAGAFPGNVIAAGGSGNATVGIDTAQAGNRSGTVSFALATDGEGTSELGQLAIGSQAVTVNASVFALANPALPADFAFTNRRVGDAAQAFITVSNPQLGSVPVGFQEGLDIATGVVSGPFSGAGSITNLGAGASNSAQLSVSMDTATAGAKAGLATYILASNGSGTSGLANFALGGDSVSLSGAVFRTATSAVSPAPSTLKARIGDVTTHIVTISNIALADGFSESLGVTGNTSGSGVNFTSANGLIAAGGNRQVTASVDTAAAGAKSGTLDLAFTSDGAGTSGLAAIGAGNGSVTINADVYALANAQLPSSQSLGNARVGTVASGFISVSNVLPMNVPIGFHEGLDVSTGVVTGSFTGSGNVTNLASGSSSNAALAVTMDTATAGNKTGTVNYSLASNGNGTSGLATLGLPGGSVELSGAVFRTATSNVSPAPSTLRLRVGGTAEAVITISNSALADGFSESLGVIGNTSGSGVSFTNANGLIVAGGNRAVTASVNSMTAGAKTGTLDLTFTSDGAGTSGLAAISAGTGSVTVNAEVFALANPNLVDAFSFGNRRVGDAAQAFITVSNPQLGAVPVGFQEGLDIATGVVSGSFSGSGGVVNLAAGGSNSAQLSVSMDTATAGEKLGTANYALTSNGTGTSGLANFALGGDSVALSGAVFRLAQATVAPAPLELGNVRQGSTASGVVTISNAAAADGFSEGLRLTGASPSGSATAGAVPGGLIAAGDSANATIGINTAQAGNRTGTVSFALASDGAGTSGFSEISLGSQAVTVNATVFALANPILLADLNFGNVQAGSLQTRVITVSNAQLAGAMGFQEGLNASFGTTAAGFSGAGAVTNLAAGGTDTTTLVVTLDTTAAGAFGGQVQVLLVSNGAGTSGLGTFALDPQSFTASASVQAGVFRLAEASVAPTVIPLGNRRVGDAAPAPTALTISNIALADGFSESLDASVGATSGRATGAGSASLIAAGGSSQAISVGIDTSVAGANGSVTIALASNGAGTSDLGITPLPSQVVTLGGGVYRLAAADVSSPVGPSVARVGDVASSSFTIANTAVADGFSESLGVIGSTSGSGIGFSSADGLISAGGNRLVTASIDTAVAGAKSGTLGLVFSSDGAGTSGLAALGIGSDSVTVEAEVYAAAVAQALPAVIDFGVVRVGDVVPAQAFSVGNIAVGALTDTLVTTLGTAPAGFTVGAAPGAIAAGNSADVAVGIDTASAGSLNGMLDLAFASRNPVLADLALAGQSVSLTGIVNNHAAPVFTLGGNALAFDAGLGGYVFDFGSVEEGSSLTLAGFGLGNLVFGPADALSGQVTDSLGGIFSLGSAVDVGLLSAGSISNPFSVFVQTSAAGMFSGQLQFAGVGTNASDLIGETRSAKLFLSGKVTATPPVNPIPEPATWAMMIIGFGAIGMAARRRRPGQAVAIAA